jgi:Sec-independent protein translocase protein TatA
MFGLGFWEIAIIIIVILLLFRPEDIPKLLRGAGKVSRQLKDFYREATSSINDIGKEVKRPIDEIKRASKIEDWWKDTSADNADSDKPQIT